MKSFRTAREALIAVFVCSIFNEYHAYEYSLKNNKVLADLLNLTRNVIQSLEQQFDYLFKCAGVSEVNHVLGFKRAPHHNHYH